MTFMAELYKMLLTVSEASLVEGITNFWPQKPGRGQSHLTSHNTKNNKYR
jgi:hypothetical protein